MCKKENLFRIYANCRRGMLELDLILLHFVEKEILNLDNKSVKLFSELLNETDITLQKWLIKEQTYTGDKFKDLIKKVIDSKKTIVKKK
ncbi:MAG TPA: FAD assembly factor SdhE [Candidatus Azoamicus sp.]